MATPKKYKNWLLLILLIALLLRVGYFIEYRFRNPLYKYPMTDSFMYMKWAERIAEGEWIGNKVYWQAPFYPYFLAITKVSIPDPKTFMYILQLMLGLINLFLIYRLARITINEKVGLWAVLLCSFYAPFIYYEAKILADTFGIFFMLAGINFLMQGLGNGKYKDFLFAGLLLGIGCIIRAFYLVFFVLSILGIYLTIQKKEVHYIKKILIYSLACLSIISIVTIRNYLVGKDFVLISYSAGTTFCHGNNPYSRGAFGPGIAKFIPAAREEAESQRIAEKTLGRPLKPSEVSAFWVKKGLEFLRTHPKRALWLFKRKFLLSTNSYEVGAAYNFAVEKEFMIFLKIIFVPFGFIFSAGIIGMILGRQRIKRLWPLHVYILTIYATLYIFYVSSRYRLHSVPLLAIFAGLGIEEFIKLIKEKRLKHVLLYSIIFISILAFSYIPTGADKETAASRTNLGYGYLMDKNEERAIECFKKAVSVNPRYASGWMALGDTYYKRGEYRDALNAYEQVIMIGPSRLYNRAQKKIKDCQVIIKDGQL